MAHPLGRTGAFGRKWTNSRVNRFEGPSTCWIEKQKVSRLSNPSGHFAATWNELYYFHLLSVTSSTLDSFYLLYRRLFFEQKVATFLLSCFFQTENFIWFDWMQVCCSSLEPMWKYFSREKRKSTQRSSAHKLCSHWDIENIKPFICGLILIEHTRHEQSSSSGGEFDEFKHPHTHIRLYKWTGAKYFWWQLLHADWKDLYRYLPRTHSFIVSRWICDCWCDLMYKNISSRRKLKCKGKSRMFLMVCCWLCYHSRSHHRNHNQTVIFVQAVHIFTLLLKNTVQNFKLAKTEIKNIV